MKKIAISLVAVVAAILMCFGLVACGSSVSGNTYVYDGIEVDGKSSDEMDALYGVMLGSMEITFNEDGTCTSMGGTSYYKQDGKTVYIYETKEDADAGDTSKAEGSIKVSGSKIKMEEDMGGVKLTIVLKKK